ncbi:hypothetical protein [Chryseobacterium kwangjuense]|uniref:Uncharacterized protein n=1 Tax=Chryseobacterium kwangjuense TaxID=267125 RepID=A0A135W274_9FLAO|nr:hypothetical protein [Chryseobacterium kwangjuense]KXH79028.1 hypothetical protein AU378_20405 [Chryseobacterium kwangjuense]
MITLSKKEKRLILSAFQCEKETLSKEELSIEDNSTVKLIENEIKVHQSFFSIGQLELIINYLDLVSEKDGCINREVLNLQNKISAYLQTV